MTSNQDIINYNIKNIKTIENSINISEQIEEKIYISKLKNAIKNYSNGLYKETIIIRNIDDTFLAFKAKVEIIDENDLGSCLKIIDEAILNEVNILIDSRLLNILNYVMLKYGDKIFIYNTFQGKIINVYRFYSELYSLTINELSLNKIIYISLIKLLVLNYMKHFMIPCVNINVIKYVNNISNNNKSHNFISVIINIIGIQKQNSVNKRNVDYFIQLINKFFSNDILNKYEKNSIKKWDLKDINMYEILTALTLMLNTNYNLSLIEGI